MLEVVVVRQVDGQGRVVRVGGLILGLAQRLEGVREGLETPDQLVGADVLGDLISLEK